MVVSKYLSIGYYKYPSYWFVASCFLRKQAKPNFVILDAGCGKGSSMSLLPPGIHAVGLDINRKNTHISKKRFPRFDFVVASLNNLPFCDNVFKGITAIDVIEHLDDANKPFAEMNRVNQRNGFFIGCSTNILNPLLWFDVKYPAIAEVLVNKFAQAGHYDRHFRYSPKSLSKIVTSAGFFIDSYIMVGAPLFDKNKRSSSFVSYLWIFFDRLTSRAPFIFLKEEFVWLCKNEK